MGPILNLANTRLVNAAVELLDPQPKDTVLDIGFGGGLSAIQTAPASSCRGWPASSCPLSGVDVQTINQFAKFPARFEEGNSLRRHFDSGSGFGIAPYACSSLARMEIGRASCRERV